MTFGGPFNPNDSVVQFYDSVPEQNHTDTRNACCLPEDKRVWRELVLKNDHYSSSQERITLCRSCWKQTLLSSLLLSPCVLITVVPRLWEALRFSPKWFILWESLDTWSSLLCMDAVLLHLNIGTAPDTTVPTYLEIYRHYRSSGIQLCAGSALNLPTKVQ